MLASGPWFHALLQPPWIFALLGLMIPILGVLGHFWYSMHRVNEVSRLVRRMLDQGFTADQIERVLKSGGLNEKDRAAANPFHSQNPA